MKQYIKLYGPINGIVCIGLGLLFFIFNVLLIEFEDTTMQILMFTPVPLILIGSSLLIFPGAKLTRNEIHDKNISFWSTSPKLHKSFWLLMGIIGITFLILQLLCLLDIIEISFNNCFFSKYLGIGNCLR
jgi:hypothetical protein